MERIYSVFSPCVIPFALPSLLHFYSSLPALLSSILPFSNSPLAYAFRSACHSSSSSQFFTRLFLLSAIFFRHCLRAALFSPALFVLCPCCSPSAFLRASFLAVFVPLFVIRFVLQHSRSVFFLRLAVRVSLPSCRHSVFIRCFIASVIPFFIASYLSSCDGFMPSFIPLSFIYSSLRGSLLQRFSSSPAPRNFIIFYSCILFLHRAKLSSSRSSNIRSSALNISILVFVVVSPF